MGLLGRELIRHGGPGRGIRTKGETLYRPGGTGGGGSLHEGRPCKTSRERDQKFREKSRVLLLTTVVQGFGKKRFTESPRGVCSRTDFLEVILPDLRGEHRAYFWGRTGETSVSPGAKGKRAGVDDCSNL